MKLRYYLRGLGIGIVVTALIMGLSNRDARPLTDAEIKAKAATLGMVESDSLRLADVAVMPEAEPGEEPAQTPDAEPDEEPAQTSEAEPGGEPAQTPDAETGGEPAQIPDAETDREPAQTPEAETGGESVKTPETEQPGDGEQEETISVTIESGSGSGTVCRQLEEAGLIESATSFDRYLIDNGYSKRISVGTYEIRVGATEEEIAKIITKTR